MICERDVMRAVMGLVVVSVVGLGYNQMRARADGIPAAQGCSSI